MMWHKYLIFSEKSCRVSDCSPVTEKTKAFSKERVFPADSDFNVKFYYFFCLLAVLAFYCPCFLASFCVFSVSVVLTAAVTQASLQSMLHKILTAGPSAFNITTLLSQATQLSSQGTYTHRSICLVLPLLSNLLFFYSCYNAIQIMSWLIWF